MVNLAGHIQSQVIGQRQLDQFIRRSARSDADFSSRSNALRSDPIGMMSVTVEDLHFASNAGPKNTDDLLLLRVAPMEFILNNVEPIKTGVAEKKRFGRAKSVLRAMSDKKVGEKEIVEYERRFRAFLFERAETTQIIESWSLGSSWHGQLLAKGQLRRQAVGFRKRDGRPIFFATVENCEKLFDNDCESGLADALRDRLGLDHLGKYFNDQRVILGWYCFRHRQYSASIPKRPTPFDNTSPARFKASYGEFGKARGSMGRTADLSKIELGDSRDSIDGLTEIVCPNEMLNTNDAEVLFGYLGPLNVPRNDNYVYSKSGSELDRLFIEKCLGAWDRDAVIATIINGTR